MNALIALFNFNGIERIVILDLDDYSNEISKAKSYIKKTYLADKDGFKFYQCEIPDVYTLPCDRELSHH